MAAVVDVGEFEEDQTEHRGAVFGGAEVGVGAQIIGCGSEIVFELFELVAGHGVMPVDRGCCEFLLLPWSILLVERT
jgi:hypothetical protein